MHVSPDRLFLARALAPVLVCFVWLSASPTAYGQDDDEDEEQDVDETDDDEDEGEDSDLDLDTARKLYREGNADYAAGRYEDAAQAFERGYELSRLSGFLYNMANAYERLGEYGKAAEKLELYLESPKAKNVESVRERVLRLREADQRARDRKRERDLEREREREADGPLGDEPDDEQGAEEESSSGSRLHIYLLGGGGAMLATGLVLGGISQLAKTNAETNCDQSGVCDRDAEGDLNREKTFARLADVSFGLGAALVAAGAVTYFLNRGSSSDAESNGGLGSVAIAPTAWADGAALSVSGRF